MESMASPLYLILSTDILQLQSLAGMVSFVRCRGRTEWCTSGSVLRSISLFPFVSLILCNRQTNYPRWHRVDSSKKKAIRLLDRKRTFENWGHGNTVHCHRLVFILKPETGIKLTEGIKISIKIISNQIYRLCSKSLASHLGTWN